MNPKRLFFTICSANYLAYAYTLGESLEEVLPGADFRIVLADELPQGLGLPAHVIGGSELGIANYFDMAMRYDIVEFNTAIKPFVILELFRRYPDCTEIYYLDPDLQFFSAPLEVFQAFENGAQVVLTPHISEPVEDRLAPDDFTHMRSGIYNLGFGAFGRSPETLEFLAWWSRRLKADCRIDLENGIFVDQKYLDLATCFLDRVAVLRNPGLNVAYWNLPHRCVARAASGDLTANGSPLRFFHFSGVDPIRPHLLSKHQERYETAISAGPEIAGLVARYADSLARHGHKDLNRLPYAYASLVDGTPITREMRRVYRRARPPAALSQAEAFAPDFTPYNRAAEGVPFREDLPITELMHEVWRGRGDLQAAFPMSTDEGRRQFFHWFKDTAGREHGLPAQLIAPLNQAAATTCPPVRTRRDYGATVFGFLRAETGVGEVGRRTLRALKQVGLPVSARNFSSTAFEEMDDSAQAELSNQLPYRYHLYQINADNTARLPYLTGYGDWFDRYNIGMWAWELPRFPQAFRQAFDYVDEVWAPSEFVSHGIRQATGKPVKTIPHAVPIEHADPRFDRGYFGLPEDALTVLVTMDFNSFASRKNPMGAVDAFRRAFKATDQTVRLVLKVHGRGCAESRARLRDRIAGVANVTLIDRVLSRSEMTGLQASCDVFLSMHRSEGFGLNIAECMAQGKLVVVTDYSGSRDFVDSTCGAPVGFSLVPLTGADYPFGEGQWWADPDLDQAAEILRRAADDPAWRTNLGISARRRVAERLSLEAVGYAMRGRLDDLEFGLP